MENYTEILSKIKGFVGDQSLIIKKKSVQTSPSAAFIESVQQIEDNTVKQQILSSLMGLMQQGLEREKAAEIMLDEVYRVLEAQGKPEIPPEEVDVKQPEDIPQQTMDVSVLTGGNDRITQIFKQIYPVNDIASQLKQFGDLSPEDYNRLSFEVYTSGRMKNDSKQEESGALEINSPQGKEFIQSELAQEISDRSSRMVDDRKKDALQTALLQSFSPNLVLALDKKRGYFIQDKIDKRLFFFLRNLPILRRYNTEVLRPVGKDLAQELEKSGVNLTSLFGGAGNNTKTNEFKKAYEIIGKYAVDTPQHIGLFSYISQLIKQRDESIPRWIKYVASRIFSEEYGRENKPFEIGKGEGEKEMERTDFVQPGEQRGQSLDKLKKDIAVQKARLEEVSNLNNRLVEIFDRVDQIATNITSELRSKKTAKPFTADLIQQSVNVAKSRIQELVTKNNLKKRRIQELTEKEPTTLEEAQQMMQELYQETESEQKDLSAVNELLEFGNKTGRILRYEFSPEGIGDEQKVKNFRSLLYQNNLIDAMDKLGREKLIMIDRVKNRLRQNGNSVEEAATFLGIDIKDAAMYASATPDDVEFIKARYLDLNDAEIKRLMDQNNIPETGFNKFKDNIKRTHYRHVNQTVKDGIGGWIPLVVSQLENNLDPIGRQSIRALLALTDAHSDIKKGGIGRVKGGKMTYKFKPSDSALYYLLSKGEIPSNVQEVIDSSQKITPEQEKLIEKVRQMVVQSFYMLVNRIMKLGELSDNLQKLANNDAILKRIRQLIEDFQEDYDVYKRML